jgi:hypothetical protein
MEHLPVATPIGGEVVISVTIPNGVLPGQPLNVQAPDGRMFQIIVPQDVRAGQTINVVVDNSAQSGSSTTMAAGGGSSSAMSMPPVNPTDPRSNRAAIGAAAAAAVAGTLIIGPVTGVCVAGAALYATTREDEVGQIARQVRASLTFCVDANFHSFSPLLFITHLLQAGSAACYAYDTAKQNGVFDKLMSAGKATLDKVRHQFIPFHFSCCTEVTRFAPRIVR